MTEPMNPAEIAAMVADLKAGTKGPWREAQTWRPPIGNGPHNDMVNGKIFWGYSICGSNEHGGHIYPTLASVHNFPDHIHANAARIARVPAMEQTILALSAQLAAVTAERDELAAAIDSIETSNGLTSNGNLWRFWVKKSQELLDKNKVLSAQLTTLQREAVTQARHDVKIYAMTAERDYDRRQTAHLQTVVDKLNAHIYAMTAERDAAVARVKMVTDLVEWACDTLTEINPSNYGHDDVCRLNDRSVEVIIGLSALTEGTPT